MAFDVAVFSILPANFFFINAQVLKHRCLEMLLNMVMQANWAPVKTMMFDS